MLKILEEKICKIFYFTARKIKSSRIKKNFVVQLLKNQGYALKCLRQFSEFDFQEGSAVQFFNEITFRIKHSVTPRYSSIPYEFTFMCCQITSSSQDLKYNFFFLIFTNLKSIDIQQNLITTNTEKKLQTRHYTNLEHRKIPFHHLLYAQFACIFIYLK